jgi:hypothetical protein
MTTEVKIDTAVQTPVDVASPAVAASSAPPAAPAVATPPPATPTTPLTPEQPATQTKTPPANWSDNWRETALKEAGLDGDEAAKNLVNRYTSPSAAVKALVELNKLKSAGGIKQPFPKDNPDAQARWRQENGIPETPEKYDLSMPDGLVIGEADRPLVDEYLKVAHTNNIHPDVVKSTLGWYMGQQTKLLQDMQKMDSEFAKKSENELRQEWGGNYDTHLTELSNFYSSAFPKDVAEQIENARMPDGTRFGNNPNVVRAFLSLAREVNPGATVVPGASNAMSSIDSEMATIERKMGTVAYSERDASRYMELVSAKDKMSARR